MSDFSIWTYLGDNYPDVTVHLCALPSLHAVWVPSERTILLNADLPPEGRRSRLAHEVAHIVRGDRHNGHGYFDRIQELGAEQLAAQWLLPESRLQSTELYGRTGSDVAQELGVDLAMLKVRVEHLRTAPRSRQSGCLIVEGAA